MQRLEKENLKKDVRILQLEKQLQAAVFSRVQVSRLLFMVMMYIILYCCQGTMVNLVCGTNFQRGKNPLNCVMVLEDVVAGW